MSTAGWKNPSTPSVKSGSGRFSEAQWRELLHEDNLALSSISLLLAAIIGAGMVGMAVVVAILAFGG
ncbi:MAG TPA: hypothetical protein VFI31_06260 [Pirellulales bacterium]|nr:hypothetical protein [Pirellulales bacterium]